MLRIFGPKREEVAEAEEDCIMRSFITCMLHQVIKSKRMGGARSTHGSDEKCIQYFCCKI
jgi:hypothetical protein